MEPEKEEKIPGFIVYAGPRSNGTGFLHLYYRLPDRALNTPNAEGKDLKTFYSDKKLFKFGTIGSIYEIEFSGNTLRFRKENRPTDYWRNEVDSAEWQSHEIAFKTAKSLKEGVLKNTMIASLQPVRRAYKEANVDGRRAILAETIRIITA